MRTRKLYQILTLFSADDLQSFRHYLDSPLFNSSKALANYYEAFRKMVIEDEKGEGLSLELFAEKTGMKTNRINKLSSELYNKALDYLSFSAYQSKESARQEYLLEALSKRPQASTIFQQHFARISTKMAQVPESMEKYGDLFRLHSFSTFQKVQHRAGGVNWQEEFGRLADFLDLDYLHRKLNLISGLANAGIVLNQDDLDPGVFPPVLRLLLNRPNIPAMARAYTLVLEMFLPKPNETAFFDLIRHLDGTIAEYGKKDALNLYSYAINFCIDRINAGTPDFLDHTNAIYKTLLKNELLLSKGKLPTQQFKNIVALHCRQGELDWVEAFIAEFGTQLEADPDGHALQYNEGVLQFHRGNYALAISMFKKMIVLLKDDPFYGADARAYLWKSYFEQTDELSASEVDEMERLYDSFRVFIDRNDKISPVHKQHYRNFIREFKRMIELLTKTKRDPQKLNDFEAELRAMPNVSNKTWMLERLATELEK